MNVSIPSVSRTAALPAVAPATAAAAATAATAATDLSRDTFESALRRFEVDLSDVVGFSAGVHPAWHSGGGPVTPPATPPVTPPATPPAGGVDFPVA